MKNEHEWTAIVTIPLNNEQAEQILKTGLLDEDYYRKQQPVEVGCIKCEKEINEAWGKPCREVHND